MEFVKKMKLDKIKFQQLSFIALIGKKLVSVYLHVLNYEHKFQVNLMSNSGN